MSTKKKYKRDYIILEAKDMNYRYKDRVLPKAFAKVEVTEDKSLVALYVENLKYVREGYKVVAILDDYETSDLGRIIVSEQGKGEFSLSLDESNTNIKAVAMIHEKSIPLIGFKGSKIDNYEEILFTADDEYLEYEEEDDSYEDEEYEYEYEYEYIEEDEYEEENNEYDNNYREYEEDEYDENDNYQEYVKASPREQQNVRVTKQANNKHDNPYIQDSYDEVVREVHDYVEYEEAEVEKVKNLLMPRQIKKGLKMFKEVKPFVTDSIDKTRWWKIEITPITMCGYTMPYLGYINTLNYTMYSDTVLQSYRYRHYLFGVQYDEYNKRKNYIYAIPGNKNEQPDQGHTGFNVYKPCDDRNDKLGYWICFVDARSRKIVK